jgi:hypothetical protein
MKNPTLTQRFFAPGDWYEGDRPCLPQQAYPGLLTRLRDRGLIGKPRLKYAINIRRK